MTYLVRSFSSQRIEIEIEIDCIFNGLLEVRVPITSGKGNIHLQNEQKQQTTSWENRNIQD